MEKIIKEKGGRIGIKMNSKRIWVNIERIVIDTGKDDEETLRKFLGINKKDVINLKKYKELKEER